MERIESISRPENITKPKYLIVWESVLRADIDESWDLGTWQTYTFTLNGNLFVLQNRREADYLYHPNGLAINHYKKK